MIDSFKLESVRHKNNIESDNFGFKKSVHRLPNKKVQYLV